MLWINGSQHTGLYHSPQLTVSTHSCLITVGSAVCPPLVLISRPFHPHSSCPSSGLPISNQDPCATPSLVSLIWSGPAVGHHSVAWCSDLRHHSSAQKPSIAPHCPKETVQRKCQYSKCPFPPLTLPHRRQKHPCAAPPGLCIGSALYLNSPLCVCQACSLPCLRQPLLQSPPFNSVSR